MLEFRKLFSTLNRKRVRYLVVGGVAVNLYGVERATGELDLVVDLEDRNLKRFIRAMKELGFKPKVPVALDDLARGEKRKEWAREKGMKVFSLFDSKQPFFLLDVMIEMPFDFDAVYSEREKMSVGRLIIPVVPLTHLINMKEKTGRPQDRADSYYLKKIREELK